MPKLDKSRNYYADLELSTTASADDIKKQYRKLAMKWHPDRNPGREADVSPRFQLIQSAHEILSDEVQKRQYDEARGSVKGRYTGASGVRGNPWADAAKDFAPPPRRHPQQPSSSSSSQARPRPSSGAQRYANFTNAMPKSSRTTPEDDAHLRKTTASAFESMRSGRSKVPPPPTPPRAPTGATQPPRAQQPPPPPPRTASQAQKAQASFGNSSRKTGFHPHAPGVGDEPPVTSKNYFTDRTHSQHYEPPRPEPTEIPNTTQASSGIPDPLSQFRENGTDRRSSTPYTTGKGEKTSLFPGSPALGRAASTRSPIPRKDVPNNTQPQRPRSSSPRRPADDGRDRSDYASPSHSRASERYTPRADPARDRPFFDDEVSPTRAPRDRRPAPGSTLRNQQPNSVFGHGDGASRNQSDPTMATKGSAENINMSFVPEEGSGSWQFTAGGATDGTSSSIKPRSHSAGRPVRRATGSKSTKQQASSNPSPQDSPQPQQPDGFSAGEWTEKISSQHFVPQPSGSAAASPTRRGTGKKSKPVRKTTGTAGLVDSDDSEGWQEIPKPASSGFDSPTAMDIDTPPPHNAEAPTQDHARKIPVEPSRPDWRAGAANVPATTYVSSPTSEDAPDLSSLATTTTSPGPALPPKISLFAIQHGGSEDSEEFRTTLSDLKQTEPFMDPPATGLKSFADLQSTLPFQSRASEQIPLEKKEPVPLEFPTAPVAPRLPPTVAVTGIRPNMAAWRKYASDFNIYMEKWEIFNGKVVEHFRQRQSNTIKKREMFGTGWLESSTLSGSDPVTSYMSELHQDWDVRRKWMDACGDHKDRVREFYEFRERMK
ncbi:DnaJ domain-containing protein [Microdochium nivale]|nr:DnaJ domain-containing protein [Microdochium nivale]